MGMWDSNTNSHKESLINTIQEIADVLNITRNDIILDAGCGVGGSAIYLATKYACNVTGIANSQALITTAKERLSNSSVSNKVNFQYMDFNNVTLPDESFTIIFGLESVSHSEDKPRFASEAFRLLKPGGKLLISDGFISKNDLSDNEMAMYQQFIDGWAIPDLKIPTEFITILENVGFTNVDYSEKTDSVQKSIDRSIY